MLHSVFRQVFTDVSEYRNALEDREVQEVWLTIFQYFGIYLPNDEV